MNDVRSNTKWLSQRRRIDRAPRTSSFDRKPGAMTVSCLQRETMAWIGTRIWIPIATRITGARALQHVHSQHDSPFSALARM